MPELDDFLKDENFSGLLLVANDFQFPLLFDRVLSIGRNSGENIIIIRHKTVSRRHARILYDGNNFRLDDSDSTNGTFVNGKKIKSSLLKSGDEIKIGEVLLQLQGKMKTPPKDFTEAFEDPGMTQIIDLEFEKIRENAESAADLSLVEKLRQKIVDERRNLQEMAFKDGLTGVFNRRFFDIELKRILNKAKRHKRVVSLLIIDVDFFKQFNDNFGHQVGDDVLKWVGGVLLRLVRDSDIVARYGGEEMVVVLEETDALAAAVVAEKIRSYIHDNSKSSFPRTITVSIGIAEFAEDAEDDQKLINAADQALYSCKESGRNKVAMFRNIEKR